MRFISAALVAVFVAITFSASAASDADKLALHIVYVTNRDRAPIDDYRARVVLFAKGAACRANGRRFRA